MIQSQQGEGSCLFPQVLIVLEFVKISCLTDISQISQTVPHKYLWFAWMESGPLLVNIHRAHWCTAHGPESWPRCTARFCFDLKLELELNLPVKFEPLFANTSLRVPDPLLHSWTLTIHLYYLLLFCSSYQKQIKVESVFSNISPQIWIYKKISYYQNLTRISSIFRLELIWNAAIFPQDNFWPTVYFNRTIAQQ